MIYKLAVNRVRRAYTGGKRLEKLLYGYEGSDGFYPEDWLASTVEAFAQNDHEPAEGLGKTIDGSSIRTLVPKGLPILVKLLDASCRLAVQVHPTIPFAKEAFHQDQGKTESWYILEANDDACVYLGFREGITKEMWQQVFDQQDLVKMLSLMHCFPVKKNDCIFIPGGMPHAIGGGCLMVETQEPSDLMVITERISPAGVVFSDEKLHGGLGFERMMDCFIYEGLHQQDVHKRCFMPSIPLDPCLTKRIDGADNGIFALQTMQTDQTYRHTFLEPFAICIVVSGGGELCLDGKSVSVNRGDRLLLLDLAHQPLTLIPALGTSMELVFSLPAL